MRINYLQFQNREMSTKDIKKKTKETAESDTTKLSKYSPLHIKTNVLHLYVKKLFL